MKIYRAFRFFLLFLMCAACTLRVFSQQSIRIVSLAPSVTQTLMQLGADQAIVGRTDYCPAPLDNRRRVTVGNVLEVNLEKIVALKPDLVFCMAFTKPEIIKKLTELGIKVKNFHTPRSFEEICGQTIEIGQLTNMEDAAQKMVATEKEQVATIIQEVRQSQLFSNSPKVFFQIGDNPVFPVIEGTFMNQYLTFLGLENIVTDYKGGGISREYIIGKDPDIMIISRMSGIGEQVAEGWKQFSSISAIKNGHLLIIDDNMACCPTPVFFRQTLQTIADWLKKI